MRRCLAPHTRSVARLLIRDSRNFGYSGSRVCIRPKSPRMPLRARARALRRPRAAQRASTRDGGGVRRAAASHELRVSPPRRRTRLPVRRRMFLCGGRKGTSPHRQGRGEAGARDGRGRAGLLCAMRVRGVSGNDAGRRERVWRRRWDERRGALQEAGPLQEATERAGTRPRRMSWAGVCRDARVARGWREMGCGAKALVCAVACCRARALAPRGD
jgi:hypothetical protein